MADPDIVEQLNRIIWMDAPVADDTYHVYTKELSLSGSKIVWSIVNAKVATLAMTNPHDPSEMIDLDVSDPDLDATIGMLEEKDNQGTP